MEYKNITINAYPNILLSDCKISHMAIEIMQIQLFFCKYGIVIKDEERKKFFRSKDAKIIIEGCDIDDFQIDIIKRKKNKDECTMYRMPLYEFSNKINKGKWSCTIVDEYYAENGAFLRLRICTKKYNLFWANVRMSYKQIKYMWSEMNYESPLD